MDAGWTDTEYILTLCFQKKNTPAGDLNQISERLSSLFVKPMCSNVYFNGTRGSVCRNTPAGRRAIFTPGIHLVCVTLAFTNHKQQPQAVWNIVLATLLDSERQPALAACLPYCLKKKKNKQAFISSVCHLWLTLSMKDGLFPRKWGRFSLSPPPVFLSINPARLTRGSRRR